MPPSPGHIGQDGTSDATLSALLEVVKCDEQVSAAMAWFKPKTVERIAVFSMLFFILQFFVFLEILILTLLFSVVLNAVIDKVAKPDMML